VSFHPNNINILFPGEVTVSLYLLEPGSANESTKIRISETIAEPSESFCRIGASKVRDFHTPGVGFRVAGLPNLPKQRQSA